MTDAPVLSSIDQLRGVKLQHKRVLVTEWATEEAPNGYWVNVWELTGDDVATWRASMLTKGRDGRWTVDPRKLRDQNASLLCKSLRDDDEKRLFADTDAPFLRKLGSAGIERLAEIAQRLSRIVEIQEEVEDEVKDSEPTTGLSSNSGSPHTSADL